MTDVTSDTGAGKAAVGGASAVDDGLVAELVARAQAGGVKLTGDGGLLQQLTKRVLESALEGELTDHLGHEPGERAEGGRDNCRNEQEHRLLDLVFQDVDRVGGEGRRVADLVGPHHRVQDDHVVADGQRPQPFPAVPRERGHARLAAALQRPAQYW